jgi:hypothetical protein
MQALRFLLLVMLSGSAGADETACQPLDGDEKLCTTVHRHFSGAMVVRDWFRPSDSWPYQRVIEGARAGSPLIGQARLRLDEKGRWVIRRTLLDDVVLFDPDSATLPQPTPVEESGHQWQITVEAVSLPRSTPRVATEDEVHFKVRILRIPSRPPA